MAEQPIPADTTAPRRLYKYGEWSGEFDPAFSTEDVKRHLTPYFPDLSQADTQQTTLPDGTLEITFIKRAGTKGTATISVADVRARLGTVEPLHLQAIALLVELERTPLEPPRSWPPSTSSTRRRKNLMSMPVQPRR